MDCKGYLDGCNRSAMQDTEYCDPCGDALDLDVASDLFKDEHGVRPHHWLDVNEAREYMENRNELNFPEDVETVDEWGDETTLEV